MILGIDASNISGGGGLTHLVELLGGDDSPAAFGFSKVIVWGGRRTLNTLETRPWLEKAHLPILDRNIFFRALWQTFGLSNAARAVECDVLFVPGGSYAGDFTPAVTMCQNMLPFEWRELRRFGWSIMALKLGLLRLSQLRGFRKAQGVIFLTSYARATIEAMDGVRSAGNNVVIVPHGINARFFRPPRSQNEDVLRSHARPLKLLYVSTVDMYKHQWNVVRSASQLREMGVPVDLTLIGSAYQPALEKLTRITAEVDPGKEYIHYLGAVPYAALHDCYMDVDVCVFASSCENLPIILLEAMASGVPIACSDRGPMKEILGNAGLYFDPEKPEEITRVVLAYARSPALRAEKAELAYTKAQVYSWETARSKTLEFLAKVATDAARNAPRCAR